MKKLLALVLTAALTAGLGACTGMPDEGGAAAAPGENTAAAGAADGAGGAGTYTIGITFQDLSNEWIAMMKDAVEARLKDYPHIQYTCLDGEGSAETQTSQMENFVAQKVDAILINPVDANLMIPAIRDACDKGFIVVTLSSDIAEDVGQTWVGAANEDGGELTATYLADLLGGQGNVAVMRGPIGAYAEIGRFEGYERGFQSYPGIEIVFDQTANWSREEAMSLMENWLQTGRQIDAVLCQNDEMALGALVALNDAGITIPVIGIDGIKDALDSIKVGEMTATGFQGAIDQGFGGVDMIARALSGEAIERTNIPFEMITQDNVDSYYDRIEL